MHPELTLFGRDISTYWLCALAGILATGAVALFRRKRFPSLASVDVTNAAALALVGVIIGGRILSVLTLLPVAYEYRELIAQNPSLLIDIFSNGLVFYGGLIGAIAAIALYARSYKLDSSALFDFFAPLFPLFHAFGRLGCFFNGCCHGRVCEGMGIVFEHSVVAPNGVPLFPVQLLCSALNLVIFFVLLAYERRHHLEGKALTAYLALYACGRFMVEFLRGDELRGIFFGLSTSQWISLGILLFLAYRRVSAKRQAGA